MISKSAEDDEIVRIYDGVKRLSGQINKTRVRDFVLENNFADKWKDLLHYAMVKKDCETTILVINLVVSLGVLKTRDDMVLEISEVAHGVTLAFTQKVDKYLKSDKFDQKWREHNKVLSVAKGRLKAHTGKQFLDPKYFKKSA